MGTVSISEYWVTWLKTVVESRVRKSKAEIVEEGLKRVKFGIDREVEEIKQFEEERRHETI